MIKKNDLVEIIKSLDIPFNEMISSEENTGLVPRLIYWEYLWDPQSSSGETYNTIVTYQISMYTDIPRHPKLLELKKVLIEAGLKPLITHEYIENIRQFHSYLAVDVVEDI